MPVKQKSIKYVPIIEIFKTTNNSLNLLNNLLISSQSNFIKREHLLDVS
jgi:hypothetical protein